LHPPKIAYVSLWFPLPSETFIFREEQNLRKAGLPITVHALYGPTSKLLSPEMQAASDDVRRIGSRSFLKMLSSIRYWRRKNRVAHNALWKEVPLRRWSCLEVAAENFWAFLAGFHLARLIEDDGTEHIHAAWANGPATAAWVASRLTGIPFSFAGRAGDIYPQDGALPEKIRAAAFVHTNNKTNKPYLGTLVPECAHKIRHVYNSLTLNGRAEAPVLMKSPVRLLAVGRFCRTKGFEYLLRACRILDERAFPYQLTLVGGGYLDGKLKCLTKRLGLSQRVSFPGFVTHDHITELLISRDVFVMPSVIHKSGDRDGIPNVIMEALSHRLPVVATNVSGIPELIRDEETGLLAPQRDPAALADAIMDMAADRDRAVAMAEAGRILVRKMFDPEANTKKLINIFLQEAGKTPSSGSA
jgi:colanic acid/amylovoran biosynthesis glycosyltransferase